MCGPLALALPHWGRGQGSFLAGRLLYTFAGLQRWVSLGLGVLILIGVFVSPRLVNRVPVARAVNWLKAALGTMLQRRALPALFVIGLLNGLLPCGLVYVAAAAAVATGDVIAGLRDMLAFGLGTLPLLLAISLLGSKLQFVLRFKVQRLIPASLIIVGTLLLLRGMALGIPYVSPKLPAQPNGAITCH
jgi:hypothetical protein